MKALVEDYIRESKICENKFISKPNSQYETAGSRLRLQDSRLEKREARGPDSKKLSSTWNPTMLALKGSCCPSLGDYLLHMLHALIQIRNVRPVVHGDTHCPEEAFQPFGSARRKHSEDAPCSIA